MKQLRVSLTSSKDTGDSISEIKEMTEEEKNVQDAEEMQLIAALKEVKPKKDSALDKFKYREFAQCIYLYK